MSSRKHSGSGALGSWPIVAAFVTGCALIVPSTVWAQKIVPVEVGGRKIYVNDDSLAPVTSSKVAITPIYPRYRYVYWSNTEHRWKPVPSRNIMQAARSAAAEVNSYVAHMPTKSPATQASTGASSGDSTYGSAISSESVDLAIEQAAARHRVDPNLVRAIVKVESNFNPRAVSRKGAMGLMQLMPATARELQVRNPFDPAQNVDAGVRHLKELLQNFRGDLNLTLAAYNAGAGAVQRNRGVPPYSETRNYVRRITTLYGQGGNLALQLSAPLSAPIHVTRDERGVLKITNTE